MIVCHQATCRINTLKNSREKFKEFVYVVKIDISHLEMLSAVEIFYKLPQFILIGIFQDSIKFATKDVVNLAG